MEVFGIIHTLIVGRIVYEILSIVLYDNPHEHTAFCWELLLCCVVAYKGWFVCVGGVTTS